MWEFEWLLHNAFDRTLLIMPPENPVGFGATNKSYQHRWKALREHVKALVTLPEYEKEGSVCYFWKNDDGKLFCDFAGPLHVLANHINDMVNRRT